jgi:hypothetical protein
MKKLLLVFILSGCAAVTPDDRAQAYMAFARDVRFKCSAYHFDLSANLVKEIPEMTEVCK